MTRFANVAAIVPVCALLGCTAVAGCGGGPTAVPPTAVIQISPTPSTITAGVCPPSHCGPLTGQLEVMGSIVIRETAGVAVVVNRLAFAVRRRSDNASIAGTEEAQGTRIAPNGSVTIPVAMHFDEGLAESNMKIVVSLDARDDNGHQITSTIEIEVVRPAS